MISLNYFGVPYVVVLLAAAAIAQEPATNVSIQVSELKFLVGSWEGYLEYLDYGDGKTRIRLATTVQYELGKDSINYVTTFAEPDGSKVQDKGSIRLTRDKAKLIFDGGRQQVLVKKFDPPAESYQVVLKKTGKDNNQPATFTTTILRRKSTLQITKAVKYDGQETAFVRNQYSLKRVE